MVYDSQCFMMGFLPSLSASSLTVFLFYIVTSPMNFLQYLETAVFSGNITSMYFPTLFLLITTSYISPSSTLILCPVDTYSCIKILLSITPPRKLCRFIFSQKIWPSLPSSSCLCTCCFSNILSVSLGQKLFLSLVFWPLYSQHLAQHLPWKKYSIFIEIRCK